MGYAQRMPTNDPSTVTPSAPVMQAEEAHLPELGVGAETTLSPQDEQILGDRIYLSITQGANYFDDPLIKDSLDAMGQGLVKASSVKPPFNFNFFALKDFKINAFALPGGFVAIYAGLILTAQDESELAAVMAHEVSHVLQRHIVRMLEQNKQNGWISAASFMTGMALLISGANPQAGLAFIYGGEGLRADQQLRFSREAEREADRIGFTLLRDDGYNTAAMPIFFNRMYQATKLNQSAYADFIRTHPITQERVADIQNRVRTQSNQANMTPAVRDPLMFSLLQARTRVLVNNNELEQVRVQQYFNDQLNRSIPTWRSTAARYGLVLLALARGDFPRARAQLAPLRASYPDNHYFAFTELEINLQSNQNDRKLAQKMLEKFPNQRGFINLYIETLIALNETADAIDFLRREIRAHKDELVLYEKLAQVYSSLKKDTLQHMTLAELYDRSYQFTAAIEQAEIGLRSKDLTPQDAAILKTRIKQYRANATRDKQFKLP